VLKKKVQTDAKFSPYQWSAIRRAINHAAIRGLDIILPPVSLLTGRPEDIGGMVDHWAALRFLDDPLCRQCGFPFEFTLPLAQGERPDLCSRCAAKSPAYDHARLLCNMMMLRAGLFSILNMAGGHRALPYLARK